MSDSSSEQKSMRPSIWKWLAAVGTPILLCAVLGANVEQLLLGWVYFPLRTIPQMTVDGPSLLLGAISVILFVIGLQWIGTCWLRNPTFRSEWKKIRNWRSSLVVTATLFVLFASGTALIGATHQLVWLLTDRGARASEDAGQRQLGFIASARESARRVQARNQLRQMSVGFLLYEDSVRAFPAGGVMTEDGELVHGFAAEIGPFMGYQTHEIDLTTPWNQSPNDWLFKCQLECFRNPSQPGPVFDAEGYGLSHWAGNVRVLPIRTVGEPQRGYALSEITDGPENTILLGSVSEEFKPWGHPANLRDPALGINRSPNGFGGPSQWRGAMFVMCNGSVVFLSEDTDPGIMTALATPDGGETLPEEFVSEFLR